MGAIAVVLLVVGLVAWIRYHKQRIVQGEISNTKLTGNYTYVLGNYVTADNEHGIHIFLPKPVPEIYIDSHTNGAFAGPLKHIKTEQKISLEGDFDEHFQVFAPENAKSLVLSILSPDVMQTLIDDTGRYDVHLSGRELSIISSKRVFGHKNREQALLVAANALVVEIDHRMISWQDQSENYAKLIRTEDQSIKIAKRWYMDMGMLMIQVPLFLISAVMIGGAVYIINYGSIEAQASVKPLVIVGVIIFPFVSTLLLYAYRQGLLDKFFE